jgi:organic hydroperoxide reductase OsmC/OhrA
VAAYRATIAWRRDGAAFTDNNYSRGHVWRFDGGIEVPASASPHAVAAPMSVAAAVDPEEALVAAISSCHMLWFLSIAAKRGYLVESYDDEAIGVMGTNAEGKPAITTVDLRPAVTFGAVNAPDSTAIAAMHEEAHEKCYIANSVKAEVRCVPSGEHINH